MRIPALALTAALVLSTLSPAQQPASRPARPQRPPARASRPAPVQPDVTQETELTVEVVELVCATKRLPEIEVKPLNEPGLSAGDLLKKLSTYGSASILLRSQQRCNLSNQVRIMTGRRMPVVQGENRTSSGVVTPTLTYERVGTKAEFAGSWTQEEQHGLRCGLDCRIEVSGLGKSGVKGAADTELATFDELRLDTHVSLISDRPTVLMTNGQPLPGPDGEEMTSVHFVRVRATRIAQ